ncbi:MAG: substrate-binding domain-containing protein, partial [Candidatus Aureabacteria bacterium]|nr:substrate-binding domain-containing protein [Candidatus Auribacterota bacterium]
MKKIIYILAGLAVALSAGSAFAGVTIKGSTTVLPIAQAAAEEFMDQNPEIDISVQGGGSSVGLSSIIEGTCDIADASRSIKDKE